MQMSSHNKNISELLKEIMLKNNFDTLFSEKDVTEMLELKPISKIYKFMKGFYKSQKYFPEMVSLGNFAMQNNNLSQAEIFYLNYLIKTKEIHNDNYHKDVFMNLASINVSKNNYRHALLCYESLLLLDPGNETAKIKEAEIRKLLK